MGGGSSPDAQIAAWRHRDYPRFYKRLRLAVAFREWPWRIPKEVVRGVGMRRPPEEVFEAFRRIHGID